MGGCGEGMLRQWGRGQMAAEGRRRDWFSPAQTMRQWGRGQMAAEGSGPASRRRMAPSVNGAAAGWPRKVALAIMLGIGTARQWGRGRMAAEGLFQGAHQRL